MGLPWARFGTDPYVSLQAGVSGFMGGAHMDEDGLRTVCGNELKTDDASLTFQIRVQQMGVFLQ